MFKAGLCDLCGDCLAKCQWIKAEKALAVQWMKSMMAGQQTPVLRQCTTCYACNEICPQKANPFDLIAQLQEQYDPEETRSGDG
jgi:heterodisulfide reductase subunit C